MLDTPTPQERRPDVTSLQKRYEILHTQLRETTNVYLKGSSMMLAIVGVSLGYLVKVELVPAHAQVLSSTVVLISVFWYVCSVAALRLSLSIRSAIRDTANALDITFESREYNALMVIIVAALCCMAPIVGVFVYFVIKPPLGQ